MVVIVEGKEYLSDNDLQVTILGSIPRIEIENEKLKNYFFKHLNRGFLGPDEIIAYSQALVSKNMNTAELEKILLAEIESGKDLKEVIFNKMATGIGRGHSLGALPGISLGIHGTKMIDAGLTGFCFSRSLVTSGRRRELSEDDIAIPRCLEGKDELLRRYLEISREVFADAAKFKNEKGRLTGVESFNKALAYNNPADLEWTISLETLFGLALKVRADKRGEEQFLPRELHALAEMLPDLTEKSGMGIMFRQRMNVPRMPYFHYNVFKNPCEGYSPVESGHGVFIERIDLDKHGIISRLENLLKIREAIVKERDPKKLVDLGNQYTEIMYELTNEYNDNVRIRVRDSVSWRVWSEQKRHSTLRQNVDSVYNAADRACEEIRDHFVEIEEGRSTTELINKLEKIIEIGDVKENEELLIPYLQHTARQLMFYQKMRNSGIEHRDAVFMVPRNLILQVEEHYDLINLIGLEMPLRLCKTCEPERNRTTWKKRRDILNALEEPLRGLFGDLLRPKCYVGYCTEGKSCNYIKLTRDDYDLELHKAITEERMGLAR